MRLVVPGAVGLATLIVAGCGGGGGDGGSGGDPSAWDRIRAAAAPEIALVSEFGPPRIQACASDGWEDGIAISRDGLHLFAIYSPADLLGFTLAGADQNHAADFRRGPTLGMDLTTNPLSLPMWLHGDIIHATRTSVDKPFAHWRLSAMARPFTSEGAPLALDPEADGWGMFVYTTNENAPYTTDVVLIRHAATDPAGNGGLLAGTLLPAPVNTTANEDNPHLERLSATDLVLFFDSDDRPGGVGMHDIWYTTSGDDGVTWTAPALATTIDTAGKEHQPHLYQAGNGTWWLYFTSNQRGKDEIWRSAQGTPGNWDSWGTPELVVGAGNTAGVGEPTLTSAGDLSFVVVYEDTVHGTATDRFDADPWFAPHVPSGVAGRLRPATAAAAFLPPLR